MINQARLYSTIEPEVLAKQQGARAMGAASFSRASVSYIYHQI